MRILIVDDSSQIRLVIQRYIASFPGHQFEFIQASNGTEAKKIVQESLLFDKPIDLIFLDWHMPEKNGLDFLIETRAVEKFNVLPLVIMLSAETYPQQIEACLSHGVVAYLTKPFTESEIHTAYLKAYEILNGVRHAV